MTYPTDLTPQEQELAQARLRELAERFAADGTLHSPQWRAVFERTWRHPYVPSYYPEPGSPCVLSTDPGRRGEWLEAVYSDQTLITKVVQMPLPPKLGPGTYPAYTASSTMPSLVLSMLEALEVTDCCRVLEIGTGSGYNAALLCERLGSEHVTSVDIDPELIELARDRLSANGYTPTLAAVDGADGYPPGAPYDRIIATAAVSDIPPAWLEQAAPGAVILADVHGTLGGTLARLTLKDDKVATGRFLPRWAGFMALRHTVDLSPPAPLRRMADEPVDSVSQVAPALLKSDSRFGFIVQWHVGDVTWGTLAEDGQNYTFLSAADGSWAQAGTASTEKGFPVRQAGPRRLWDRVEEAYGFWQEAGRPSYEEFGITATPTECYVWYDQPDSKHRWSLSDPMPGR